MDDLPKAHCIISSMTLKGSISFSGQKRMSKTLGNIPLFPHFPVLFDSESLIKDNRLMVLKKGEEAMFRKTRLIMVLICLLLVNCSSLTKKDDIRWVTLDDIARSIENQLPMNVGFDIDDALLFSSPGYYYGKQKYSPGDNAYLLKEEFWNEMNNGLDLFSIPKECARMLIELHKTRGDSIYYITGRTKTRTETVTELLAKTFGIENPNEVIFCGFRTGENTKIRPLKENSIQIFYGDSDSDIRAAQVSGIRAIRIMRAGNSTYKPLPKNGSLGEEVLVNSEY